jgi:hypothetical protein
VVFVPTDHVGGFNAFDYGRTDEPLEKLCGWSELKRLESAGVSVQSHTYGGGAFDPWQADRFRLDRIAVGPGTSFASPQRIALAA